MEPTASFDGSPAVNPNRAASAVCARVRHADRPDVAPIFYRTVATHPTRAAVAHWSRYVFRFKFQKFVHTCADSHLATVFVVQSATGPRVPCRHDCSPCPCCRVALATSTHRQQPTRCNVQGWVSFLGSTAARLAPHRSESPLSNPPFAAVHQFDSQWKGCSMWSGAAAMPDAGGPIDGWTLRCGSIEPWPTLSIHRMVASKGSID